MNIGLKENMTVEFKSDKNKLSDSDLVDSVVAFANTDGGDLYLGIEDDGEITGVHKAHRDTTQLAAYIANKTVPPISVIIEKCNNDYIKISVPKSRSIVASSVGKIQRRRLKTDGTPENVPMYPHEITSRLSDLSLLDFSGLCVPDSSYSDLDKLERERLRSIIRRNTRAEQNLLELDDEELDKALRLAVEQNGQMIPTYCGMILIGKEESIKRCVPTSAAAFQVMKASNIVMNESFSGSLLKSIETIETYMDARNSSSEIEYGLFRITVFDFDKRAFREALVNAFCHRDYTMLGQVCILLDDDGLTISNPGGFIEGVSLNNLLTVEPHGRNTALADALKRIGLAERTGRGIDRIFEGSLLYGKPLPDYSESNSVCVKLFIPKSLPDRSFTKLISDEQSRTGEPFPVNSLLVLNELKRNRRMTVAELSDNIHISETKVRTTVERLVESGIIEARGTGKGRYYNFSAKLYKESDNVSGYVRQTGIDEIRYPKMIMKYIEANYGKITRGEAAQLLRVNVQQAYSLLKKMTQDGKLIVVGRGRYTYYCKK